jgi:hypothetical protein
MHESSIVCSGVNLSLPANQVIAVEETTGLAARSWFRLTSVDSDKVSQYNLELPDYLLFLQVADYIGGKVTGSGRSNRSVKMRFEIGDGA